MNVNLWGPSMWVILQNVAFMMDKQQRAPEYLLKNLQILLPCPACQRSYTLFYAKLPWQPYQTARYVYDLHNLVNRKLNEQVIETAVENVKRSPDVRVDLAGNAFKVMLLNQYDVLFRVPTFEVVRKRYEMNKADSVPEKDVKIMLLAFTTNFKPEHFEPLQQWLNEVNEYLRSPSIYEYLSEYTNDKEKLLRTVRRIKYNNEFDESANLIRAGACIKNSCI